MAAGHGAAGAHDRVPGGVSRPARQDAPHHAVGATGPAGADATAGGVRAAAVVAVGAAVALHVVRSGTDPRSHRLSEYATGAWGWLMVVAFGAAAVAAWLLRGAVPEARGARAIRWLLAVAAVALVTSAAVPTATATVPLREAVHSLASTAATIALTAAAVWWVTLGRSVMAMRAGRVPAMVAASVAVAGVLVSPATHDGPWTGLVQRLTWLALAGWLALAAGVGVRRRSRR
jgi:hypothetical protein